MNEKKDAKIMYLLMTMAALFWAGAFIGGKIAVAELPPFTLTFVRFLIASLILWPLLLKYEPIGWKLAIRDLPSVIFLGLTGMFAYHALFFYALQYTTAINTSIISASSPIVTTVFAALMVGESLGVKRMIAALLAFFGVLLTVSNGSLEVFRTIDFNTGDLFMISASLCKTVYIIYSRKVRVQYSPLVITTYSILVCVVLSVPFAIVEKPQLFLPYVSSAGWLSILYMAIFPSVLGYLFQQFAIQSIGASKTTAFENLVPVFAIALSTLILQETATLLKLLSAAIIIAGVTMNSMIQDGNKDSRQQKIKNDNTDMEKIQIRQGQGQSSKIVARKGL